MIQSGAAAKFPNILNMFLGALILVGLFGLSLGSLPPFLHDPQNYVEAATSQPLWNQVGTIATDIARFSKIQFASLFGVQTALLP